MSGNKNRENKIHGNLTKGRLGDKEQGKIRGKLAKKIIKE